MFVFRGDDDEPEEDLNDGLPNVAAPHVPKTEQQLALEQAEADALVSQMDAFMSDFGGIAADVLFPKDKQI